METLGFFCYVWILHVGVAASLSAPMVYWGRHRVHWRPWELLAMILPFSVWLLLMYSGLSLSWKSLSNGVVEPMCFALTAPMAAIVRVVVGKRKSEGIWAGGILGVLCVIAAGVYFVVPGLKE